MKKRPVSIVAEEILLKVGRPLHYKELTKMLLDQCDLLGKTPHESVRSTLATNSKFKRVSEGVFGLAIWKQYPAIRFAKDIAYDILKKKRKPMNLGDLGTEIFLERKFISDPKVLVRNIYRTDKRFYYDAQLQQVGLTEWEREK
jgi:hypothetical protein